MKKFFKILGICILTIVVLLYLAFLFVLPNVVDLNQFKPEIQKIAKEQANLVVEFDNPKITVTPLLSAGIKADNFKIKLPDNSEIISADAFTGRIALPSLLLLTVKVSTAEIINPVLNIDIIDGKAFKIVKTYEDIMDKDEAKIEEKLQTAQEPFIDPALIKIIVPKVKLVNYQANINDLKANDVLALKGEELLLGYRNGESVYVKTNSVLRLNDLEKISANIDIDTFLPPPVELDEEDDEAQRVEIPFVNPVAMYKAYDLKAKVDSKIKVRTKNNKIVSYGYLNVDDFSLKLADTQLPASKLHLKTQGTKVNIDTDLHITNDDKISINGLLNYQNKPVMDMFIKSTQIQLNDVINLVKATLDAVHIKHELNPIVGEGYFVADTYIKTNFKKLESQGKIIIKDCIVKNNHKKLQLAKVNSLISLDNSILEFKDTFVEVAETVFKLAGTINEKSVADIVLTMEKMPLAKVFTMFLPDEINKVYSVKSGDINLDAKVQGELKKAKSNLKLVAEDVALTDKVNKIDYFNNNLTASFASDFKNITGDIKNNGFKLLLNGASLTCDDFDLKLLEKDIIIEPSQLKINDSGTIDIAGQIKNYIKNPIFNFSADGKIPAKDLKQFLGTDLAIFIKEKGIIPVNLNIQGDKKKQTLVAYIEADKDNYITPVDIKNVENQTTLLQAVIDFKGDRLKIKDTGFFIKNVYPDPDNNEKQIVKLTDIVNVDGTITNIDTLTPNINLIKVKMPSEITGVIVAFPQSTFKAKGSMFAMGNVKAPRVRGELDVWNIAIPELMLTIDKIASKFEGKDLNIDVKNVVANGSDYNALVAADLTPSKNFVIKTLNLTSNLTDADKLMKVSDAAMKYVPAPQPTNNKTTKSTPQSADIPVVVKDGTININTIKTGNIVLNDTTGKISLAKNIFYLNNLLTSAFKGKIKGDVSMNLISSEIKAVLQGSNLDVEKTLLDAAAMKDTLTGTMDFKTDLSLKGATYEEQMQTLKGSVDFEMKNGTLGPFGKLENLIMAENIRESAFFQSTIGAVLNSLLSFDTTHYNTLNGHLTFKNGITDINPIVSSGDIMATNIVGDFDLLKNKIDIRLRGRLGSQVSESMGILSLLNPVNLVKATPGMSMVLGKVFFLFTQAVTQAEMDAIPSFGKDISDNNSTKFQVIIRGDVAKPLTLVKSFKWLALESDIQNAQQYVNTIPVDTIPIDLTTGKEQIKEQAKKSLKEAASTIVTEDDVQAIKEGKEKVDKIKSLFKNKEQATQTIKEQAKSKALDALRGLTAPVETQENSPASVNDAA